MAWRCPFCLARIGCEGVWSIEALGMARVVTCPRRALAVRHGAPVEAGPKTPRTVNVRMASAYKYIMQQTAVLPRVGRERLGLWPQAFLGGGAS